MSAAGLLGVGAADDLGACKKRDVRVLLVSVGSVGEALRTVLDSLGGVETIEAKKVSQLVCGRSKVMMTHVPCFPVKPWKMTLVSPLMRRFSMVCE